MGDLHVDFGDELCTEETALTEAIRRVQQRRFLINAGKATRIAACQDTRSGDMNIVMSHGPNVWCTRTSQPDDGTWDAVGVNGLGDMSMGMADPTDREQGWPG